MLSCILIQQSYCHSEQISDNFGQQLLEFVHNGGEVVLQLGLELGRVHFGEGNVENHLGPLPLALDAHAAVLEHQLQQLPHQQLVELYLGGAEQRPALVDVLPLGCILL